MAARTMFTLKNDYGAFPVSYSLYWLTVRQCGTRHQAHKLFWDARDKQNPIAYLRKKIIRKWHVIDTVAMDYNKPALEAWVEKTIFHGADAKIPSRSGVSTGGLSSSGNFPNCPPPPPCTKSTPTALDTIMKGMGL